MVAERDEIDLFIYWPKMPEFCIRAERNDSYIAMLREEVERFDYELRRLVAELIGEKPRPIADEEIPK